MSAPEGVLKLNLSSNVCETAIKNVCCSPCSAAGIRDDHAVTSSRFFFPCRAWSRFFNFVTFFAARNCAALASTGLRNAVFCNADVYQSSSTVSTPAPMAAQSAVSTPEAMKHQLVNILLFYSHHNYNHYHDQNHYHYHFNRIHNQTQP